MHPSLRVARVDISDYRLPTEELAGLDDLHRQLQAVIRRHLPGVTASVLTLPVPCADGKTVDWYSDLPGQPTRLTALPVARRAVMKAKLADRLDSLRRLADALPAKVRGSEPIAALLRTATLYPDDSHVYVIGDEPVLTLWGFVLVKGKGGEQTLGTAANADRPDAQRRPKRAWAWAAAVVILASGLAGGGWFWLDQREADSLASELQAGIDARCAGQDRLGALALRIDRLDPDGTGYPDLRRRIAAEQWRCAAVRSLDESITAADWDCGRLVEIKAGLSRADQDPPVRDEDLNTPPFDSLVARLDARLGVCTLAAETAAKLDGSLGSCAAIVEIDRAFGAPAPEDEPLQPVRARLDAELDLCVLADRLVAALDSALEADDGGCAALGKLDRESAGGDVTRAPLATVRARLDAELARCDRAQAYRQALVDAQLDCIALRALDRDLLDEESEREPLRAIRRQLDDALGRCDALDQLEQSVSEAVKQP